MSVRRITVPRLTRAAVALQNQIAGRRADLALDEDWVLYDGGALPDGDGQRYRIGLCFSGWAGAIFCPHPLVQATLGTAGQAPSDLLPLCFEHVLARRLDQLEAVTGLSITVTDMALSGPPPAGSRGLGLKAFGREWRLQLAADPQTLAALLRPWPHATRPIDEVTLPVTVRLGTTSLPLAVLRGVRPGDAVLLERGATLRGMVVVAGTLLAPAGWTGQAWRLECAPTAKHAEHESWLGMNDNPDQNAAPERGEDSLPITLCFDIGRLDLTLGALRKLGTGSVLELPGSTAAPVRLTVGGRCIGSGELVDIDGRAGVRVVRIFDGD